MEKYQLIKETCLACGKANTLTAANLPEGVQVRCFSCGEALVTEHPSGSDIVYYKVGDAMVKVLRSRIHRDS